MAFLTNDKLVIVGAAGMIGSNMVQSALMMNLTSNICLYDVFSPEGVAEEMRQSGFDNVNITATTDVAEAFKDAKYIISSGGAPRKEGMTREDLLKGNCEIAEQLVSTLHALRARWQRSSALCSLRSRVALLMVATASRWQYSAAQLRLLAASSLTSSALRSSQLRSGSR